MTNSFLLTIKSHCSSFSQPQLAKMHLSKTMRVKPIQFIQLMFIICVVINPQTHQYSFASYTTLDTEKTFDFSNTNS